MSTSRFSRLKTEVRTAQTRAAARPVAVCTARSARLPFIVNQTFSTGFSSGA